MMSYVMLCYCADKDALGVQGLLEAWAWWKWDSQDKCAQPEDAIQIWLPQRGAQFGDVWCCSAWSTQTCKKQRVVRSMTAVAIVSLKWTISFTRHMNHSSFGFSCLLMCLLMSVFVLTVLTLQCMLCSWQTLASVLVLLAAKLFTWDQLLLEITRIVFWW